MTAFGKHPRLLVRQEEPFNGGPPPDLLLDSFATPNELFFVRSHGNVPEVDRAAWAVEAGRRCEGAAAVSRVLRELGGVWRVLGSLYLVPPVAWLENLYYRRVARRRSWW